MCTHVGGRERRELKRQNKEIWGSGASCADNWVVVTVTAEDALCPGELVRGSWHGDVNPKS